MPPLQDILLDETKLRRAGAVAAYLVFTVFVAYWIAVQQIYYLYLGVLAGVGLFLIVGLQRRAWILILLGWSLIGQTMLLKLPFSLRDIAVMMTACAYLIHRVVSADPMRQRWRVLDAVLLVNAMYLVFTFFLNPVGLRSLGAETIGARPYFTITLALVGYWVIWRLPNSIKTVSRIPLFILAGMTFYSSLHAAAYFFPSVPSRVPLLYAAIDVGAYFSGYTIEAEIPRYTKLGFFGDTLLITLYAYWPSWSLFNPLRPRFYAFLLGAVCLLVAGFRSVFAGNCAMFGINVWLHRGLPQFLMALVVGGALLLTLTAGQGRLYTLPNVAQRSLSFLPGKWDPVVMQDVEWSSQGRFEWWRKVLEDKSIKNWWFGDGFGASMGDWTLVTGRGAAGMAEVTGSLHSGPLTAIRYVGVVGLLLFYALAITSAVSACRCVRRCSGTMLQPVAMYLAIQLIWFPINYTLIFGAYNGDMPQLIFLAGLLRVVMRMADQLPATNQTAQGLIQPAPNPLATTRA
jgi:hypothetical protein